MTKVTYGNEEQENIVQWTLDTHVNALQDTCNDKSYIIARSEGGICDVVFQSSPCDFNVVWNNVW